jgi:hypothetical protein
VGAASAPAIGAGLLSGSGGGGVGRGAAGSVSPGTGHSTSQLMGALGVSPAGGGGSSAAGSVAGSVTNAVEEHGMPYVLVLALLLLSPASWRAHRRTLLQVRHRTELSKPQSAHLRYPWQHTPILTIARPDAVPSALTEFQSMVV